MLIQSLYCLWQQIKNQSINQSLSLSLCLEQVLILAVHVVRSEARDEKVEESSEGVRIHSGVQWFRGRADHAAVCVCGGWEGRGQSATRMLVPACLGRLPLDPPPEGALYSLQGRTLQTGYKGTAIKRCTNQIEQGFSTAHFMAPCISFDQWGMRKKLIAH